MRRYVVASRHPGRCCQDGQAQKHPCGKMWWRCENSRPLSCECQGLEFGLAVSISVRAQVAKVSVTSHAKGRRGGDTRATSSMLAAARTQWERAKAFVPSDEQIRQRIAEREKQAGEHGHVPKTQKQIDLVRRKWLRFLDAHGEVYGYDNGRRADIGACQAFHDVLLRDERVREQPRA